jgi:hypothetical protein
LGFSGAAKVCYDSRSAWCRATFSAAVFPPVFGPVMITARFSGGTQMSTGTYQQHIHEQLKM